MNVQSRPDARSAGGAFARRRAVAIAALTAAGMALAAPRPAEAGSYMVRQCTASIPGAQAAWERTSEQYRARTRCAAGGGLQIYPQANRTAQGRYGSWVWRAPEGTLFTWVRANASLTQAAGHRGQLRAVRANGGAVVFGGQHRNFRVHSRSGEFQRFESRLRCMRQDGCGRAENDSARAYAKAVFLTVTDRAAPSVSGLSGSLLDSAVVRGTREVSLIARDRGGGVRRMWVEANGATVASTVQECDLAAGYSTRLVPCPRSATATRTIDTGHRAFVTGPNYVTACVEDLALAGRPNLRCEPTRVWVDNVCPGSPRAGARLNVSFASGGSRTVIYSNRRAILTGRLTDSGGHPTAGSTICALTRVSRPGAPVILATTSYTGPEGRFAISLPPGPNRGVFIHHAQGSEVVARHGLEVRSRARPTFRAHAPRRARTGDRLRFRGGLPGPACSQRLVEIQAQLPRGRWQVFRTARTNRRCHFQASYRLRATTRPTRYRFRALVRRQPGYPFLGGVSAVRLARVLGRR